MSVVFGTQGQVVQLSQVERMLVQHRAKLAGQSASNFIRAALALRPKFQGRLAQSERDIMVDQAWEYLKEMGKDPAAFISQDEEVPAYKRRKAEEEAESRKSMMPLEQAEKLWPYEEGRKFIETNFPEVAVQLAARENGNIGARSIEIDVTRLHD